MILRKLIDAWGVVRRRREIRIIKASGLFDAAIYITRSDTRDWRGDPIVHYVLYGEAQGISPFPGFDPNYYRLKNFDVANKGINLFAHFIAFGRVEGRQPVSGVPVAATSYTTSTSGVFARSDAASDLFHSGLFDASFYALQRAINSPALGVMEAIEEYLVEGERMGYLPNSEFDPTYYGAQYPEILASGDNLFHHFVNVGRAQGRAGVPFPGIEDQIEGKVDINRDSVLLVVHETSRSGAPILGWNIAKKLKQLFNYNVVVVSVRGAGSIEAAFRQAADVVITPEGDTHLASAAIESVAKMMRIVLRPKYAIANSAATFNFAVAISKQGIPVVALVHEFSSIFGPEQDLAPFFSTVDAIVFPATIVMESALSRYPGLESKNTMIIPQGRSLLPAGAMDLRAKVSASSASTSPLRSAKRGQCFIVLGLGTVEWRKGVDLFISAAVSVRARFPDLACQFIWIGAQTAHPSRLEMAMFLREQLSRSEVADAVTLLPETSELEEVYASADALFVSSRLDPLPNVAIDAMSLGLPVVNFDNATGLAELMKSNSELNQLVVPYADTHAAATTLHRLATDQRWFQLVKSLSAELAADKFDMDRYVKKLDAIGASITKLKPTLRSDI